MYILLSNIICYCPLASCMFFATILGSFVPSWGEWVKVSTCAPLRNRYMIMLLLLMHLYPFQLQSQVYRSGNLCEGILFWGSLLFSLPMIHFTSTDKKRRRAPCCWGERPILFLKHLSWEISRSLVCLVHLLIFDSPLSLCSIIITGGPMVIILVSILISYSALGANYCVCRGCFGIVNRWTLYSSQVMKFITYFGVGHNVQFTLMRSSHCIILRVIWPSSDRLNSCLFLSSGLLDMITLLKS